MEQIIKFLSQNLEYILVWFIIQFELRFQGFWLHLFCCLVCFILAIYLPFCLLYMVCSVFEWRIKLIFCVVKKRETIRTPPLSHVSNSLFHVALKFKWALKTTPLLWMGICCSSSPCFLLLCVVLQFHPHSTNLPPLNAFWESYLNSLPFSQLHCAGKSKHISQFSGVTLESPTNGIRKGSPRVRAAEAVLQ